MDPERRLHIEKRREELQERRHVLQEQVRLEERRSLLSFELNALDERGVSYEIVFETDPLWAWLNAGFPTTFYQYRLAPRGRPPLLGSTARSSC